jgi:hypothetical protein
MRVIRFVFTVAALASVAGCSSSNPPVVPSPAPAPTATAPVNIYARIPGEISSYKLTERAIVTGMPSDSLFRFSDGSRTTLTVIIYTISPDVKVDADSQKWTAREGDKFKEVQRIRASRGQIADFVVAFADTSREKVPGFQVLEHWIASPTRYPNGAITIEMQFLYLIGGKFVKVRATVPEQGWQQTTVDDFARELARRVSGGV